MPREWYQTKPNEILEGDDEETIAQKAFNQRLVVNRKPYFFNYVYAIRGREYKQYISNTDRKAMFQFGMSVQELLEREKEGALTDEQKTFLHYYRLLMPCDNSPCVMNKICWAVEKELDGYVAKVNKETEFDGSILKSDKEYSKIAYRRIKDLYELYVKIIERAKTTHKTFKKQSNEQHNLEMLKIKVNFKQEALRLCSNEEELTNMMLDFCYKNGKSKRFVWDVFGERIVENLKEKHKRFHLPVQTDDPDEVEFEFKGLGFKMIEKSLEEFEVLEPLEEVLDDEMME